MPLEALRYSITPVGLHYLLTHYDIPAVDSAGWTLELGGLVERPQTLTLEALKARPAEELAVTMECAGNGRARLDPRPVSQPWLLEAVGTARWRGTPLGPLLEEAGPAEGAVEVLFTGADEGREGGDRPTLPAVALDRRRPRERRASGLRDERRSAAAAARLPASTDRPRLVRDDERQVADADRRLGRTVRRLPADAGYRLRQHEDEEGDPLNRMLPRSLMVPPGRPEFLSLERFVEGPCAIEGRAWSGQGEIVSVDVSDDGGSTWAQAELGEPAGRWAWRGGRTAGSRLRARTSCAAARATPAGTSSPASRCGTWAATRTTPSSASRSPSFEQLAGEAPAADHTLRSRPGQVPQLAVRGNEPVRLEARGLADQPLVRRLALRLEDDLDVDVVLLRPELGERDELVPRDVRPDRAADVLCVYENRAAVSARLLCSRRSSLPCRPRSRSRHLGLVWPSTSRRRARPCPSPA